MKNPQAAAKFSKEKKCRLACKLMFILHRQTVRLIKNPRVSLRQFSCSFANQRGKKSWIQLQC